MTRNVLGTIMLFVMTSRLATCQNCLLSEPSPQQSVVFVGESITYSCKVCSNQLILWYTNDESEWLPVGGTYPDQIENPLVIGELTLDATQETNDTKIACAVQGPTGFERSSIVKMVVQGLLEAPREIVPGVTNDSIKISWTPPFSLTSERTFYMINVSMSDELMTTSQTTEPSYVFVFADHDIDRCHDNILEFEICGVNPVGEGGIATVSITVPSNSQYCTSVPQATPDPLFTLVYFYAGLLGTVIPTLVIFIVIATVWLVLIRKRLRKSQTEPSSEIKMDINPTYVIHCPTTNNSAYGTNSRIHKVPTYEVITPHVYETIG